MGGMSGCLSPLRGNRRVAGNVVQSLRLRAAAKNLKFKGDYTYTVYRISCRHLQLPWVRNMALLMREVRSRTLFYIERRKSYFS